MATISIDPNIRYEDGRILYDFSITETAIQELNAKVEDELFERLAEKRGYVKERTCTMKYEFEDSKYYDGFDLYPVSGVECSKCKEIIYDCNTLNYCPNCGARVEEVE